MEYATIKIYHENNVYESIPLELEDSHPHTQLVKDISEMGTSHLKMLKIPTSDTSFVVVSKEQLNNSVIEIVINTETLKKTSRSRRKANDKDELVLS